MELGLISLASADDPLPDARALAHRIVANAPLSVTATLALLNAARNRDEAELWRRNDSIFAPVAASADAKEGALAFAEKRSGLVFESSFCLSFLGSLLGGISEGLQGL